MRVFVLELVFVFKFVCVLVFVFKFVFVLVFVFVFVFVFGCMRVEEIGVPTRVLAAGAFRICINLGVSPFFARAFTQLES